MMATRYVSLADDGSPIHLYGAPDGEKVRQVVWGDYLHTADAAVDTLDLLLGNPSVVDDPDARKIVGEFYKMPFITSLVRPTDRAMFDPASSNTSPPPARGEVKLGTRARDEEFPRRPWSTSARHWLDDQVGDD